MTSIIAGTIATMGFISGSGINFVQRIAVSAILAGAIVSPIRMASAGELETGSRPAGGLELTVSVTGLKSDRGQLRYCIAPRGGAFPQCSGSGALSGSVQIAQGKTAFVVRGLARGSYAVAVFHDQNDNNRLDTMIGIPREGYGFSRNPGFRPRAPRFDEAAIDLSQSTRTEIRVRYIL